MKVAVTVGVYNEEHHIMELLDALLGQTRLPEEIIFVDDGSRDKTCEIIKSYSIKNPTIRYIYQENAGPAAARNKAWKNSTSDICIFTDGDCVPSPDWIERLLVPFSNPAVGATAGTYRTMNDKFLLARFIGLEIAWRHSSYKETIDVHGTYNLAVRKTVLEEVGGLDESYPKASGEDWDMTYKISRKYKIIFVSEAIVGHYHPDDLWWYTKNQVRRGFDRVKVYNDHPGLKKGDVYTPWYIKYQVLAAGVFLLSLIFILPFFRFSYLLPAMILLFLVATTLPSTAYFIKRDRKVALYSIPIQIARNFAWAWGLAKGILKQII